MTTASPVTRSLQDILSIPAPVETSVSREFLFHETDPERPYWEQAWSLTIKTDARYQAQEFYALLELFQKAVDDAKEGVVVLTPEPARFVLTSPGYLTNLYLLTAVCIDPVFSVDEWAMLGARVGNQMDAIFDWVSAETGMVSYLLNKQLEMAKKNGNGAVSTAPSSTPASAISTRSRRRR